MGKTQVKEIDASVGRQVINDFMNMTTQMFVEMQAQTVELKNQNSEIKTQLDSIKNKFIPSTITSPLEPSINLQPPFIPFEPNSERTTEAFNKQDPASKIFKFSPENFVTSSAIHDNERSKNSNRISDLCGYKMKIRTFNGSATEDYDVWWENLCAFFELYPSLIENEKVRLFNAHLGDEARKYVHNINLRTISTVGELHEIFRKTFSDKYDWHNLLMNIKQKVDEKIRPFSIRLRIAATKCGFIGEMLDKTCVNYLKHSCLPLFQNIMSNCLHNTLYDVIIEHAIQFERSQEAKNENHFKKPPKRKFDEVLGITDENVNLEKKIKQEYTNNMKQLKDQMNSNLTNNGIARFPNSDPTELK